MTTQSRRDVLRASGVAALAAGAAGISSAVAAASLPDVGHDAELRRLWGEYIEALDALEAAKVPHRPRRQKYDEEFDALKHQYQHQLGFGELHRILWRKHRFEQTYRPIQRAYNKLARVTKAVRKAEAQTLFGIGVKLSVTEHFDESDVVESAENAREAVSN
jgi:hypothetical protein